jgi:hypothetical protein
MSKSRLNLALEATVRQNLERLQQETSADSLAATVVRAVALFDRLWTKKQEGFEILLVKGDETRVIEFY